MSEELELPEGWRWMNLKDAVKRTRQRDPSKTPNETFSYVDVSGVSNTSFQIVEAKEILGSEAPSRARRIIQTGDTILATVRPTLQRVALVPAHLNNQICSTGFCVVQADESVASSEFLYFFLLSDGVNKRLGDIQTGATYPAVSDGQVLGLELALPPHPEQRAIAEILGAIQAALAARRREQQLGQEHKAALLEQLFTRGSGGAATQETEIGAVPVGWGVVKLGKLIIDGPQNGLYKHASFYGEGTPVISINDFDLAGHFVTTDFNRIRLEDDDIKRYAVRKNDLLINRVNSLSHIGKCARIIELPEPTVFESNMMRFTVDEQKLLPEFLSYFLTLNSTRAYIRGIAKRAVAQSSINQSDLQGVTLPLPPLPEQQRIAAVLGALDAQFGALGQEVARLEELFRALLEELLSGRLRVGNLA